MILAMKYKIALLQIHPCGSNFSENMRKGMEFCRKAKDLGADMVVFPELWSTGFEMLSDEVSLEDLTEMAISLDSHFFTAFKELASELQINIAVTYLERTSGKPKNSVVIIDRTGEVILNYSKVFCCQFGGEELQKDVPDWNQVGCDIAFQPGTEFPVCTIDDISFGAMICADREFPEAAHMLLKKGAEIIIVPNACHFDSIRACLLRARAFEFLGGIAMTNYPSPKNNGHSQAYDCVAWDAEGNERDTLIVEGDEKEGVVMAEFDVDMIRKFRKEENWRVQSKLAFGE